jgi:2-succinyl-6-hydroxy-2,4-cyclohexadiene-1-carboxylate synthase
MWTLLHGFTGSPQSWSRVVARARLDCSSLIPALTGHGRDWQSRAVDSFEGEVTRLVSLLSDVEPPRLLCGYSLGARVALGLLARKPNLFEAAVLIGVHPGLSEDAARAERREVDAHRARLLREEGLAAFVAEWEELPLFATQRGLSPEILADQRGSRLDHDAEGLARSLEVLGLAAMPDYGPALASIEIPITIMAGALDAKFSRIAKVLAKGNAHIEIELVDGVGHNVLLEAPGAVVAALKSAEERSCR